MDGVLKELLAPIKQRDGFVLPVVIFALLIMSTVVVAAFLTSDDEQRSARAVRESSEAFYAAEAGLNEIWQTWNQSAVSSLAPGQALDLGSHTLNNGARYQAAVQRIDNGGQKMFTLTVAGEGRGTGPAGGRRTLSLTLTENNSAITYPRTAAMVRGNVEFGADNRAWGPGCGWGCRNNGLPWIDGGDALPDSWDIAACGPDYNPEDGSAIISDDTSSVDMNEGNDGFHEEPNPASESIDDPIIEKPLGDDAFSNFAGKTKDELVAMADHVFPEWGSFTELENNKQTTYPTVNADGSCNTDDPYNWGSPDPTHPCYNYHPIIYMPEGAEIRGTAPGGGCGYGQAIVIAHGPVKLGHHDCDGGASGSDPDPEPYEFNGVAIVEGCLELVYSTRFHGMAIVDDNMTGAVSPDCDVSGDFDGNGLIGNMNTMFEFSSCAIDKALKNNGLGDGAAGFTRLTSRAFGEPLR
jgi:hypothetical protein